MTLAALLGRVVGWWRARQRRFDEAMLWPAIRDEAVGQGLSVEMAREAFLMHAEGDPAWTSLGEDEMRRRVAKLR